MNNKSNMEKSIKNNYANIVDIILCICLVFMSIYKGSFYKQDILFPNIVVTIIGAGYVLIRLFKELFSKRGKVQKQPLIHNILGVLVMALPIAYALPIVFKTYASLSNSIYEMLRYVDFCIIYYIVKKSDIQYLYIRFVVFISGILTVLGIDQMTFRFLEPMLNKVSTGYLFEDRNRLSSTIQYANITGVIILVGYIFICMKIQKLIVKYINNKDNVNNKIKAVLPIYMLSAFATIEVIAILLTNSRMVILLLCLFNLAIVIYNVFEKRKIFALMLGLIFLIGVLVSGDIILAIITSRYIIVYIYLIIAATLSSFIIYILNSKISRNILNTLKNKVSYILKNNKIITVISILLILTILGLVLTIGKPLRIELPENNVESEVNNKVISVFKDLDGFQNGNNSLEIDITQNVPDSRYTINIIGITNEFNEEYLGTINHFDKTETKYIKEFEVTKNIKRIVLNIEMKKGDITFDKVELNNKNQKLSYVFLPENILSKFKETVDGDSSNSLRYEYFLDSIKIWKNSKIFGFGGEAFKFKYPEVQSSSYISTEAHSCILQTLVEAGAIGALVIVGIIGLTIYMALILVIKKTSVKSIYLFCSIISIMIICIFDLALSFGIMIYILAIFIGLISKEYSDISKNNLIYNNSYFKIAILSFAIVCLIPIINFSMNTYRSSLLIVPNRVETLTSEEYISDIEILNKKIKLDKYDTKNITSLISKYEEYKKALSSAYYTVEDNTKREYIKAEITSSVKSIKENTDTLVNNEYGDKYILELAAKTYFTNFMNFANIYEKQFKDKEIAYAFYLGYALKLTDRINEIAPYSSKSKEITLDIYKFYLEELTRQNDIAQSESIASICDLLEIRIKENE